MTIALQVAKALGYLHSMSPQVRGSLQPLLHRRCAVWLESRGHDDTVALVLSHGTSQGGSQPLGRDCSVEGGAALCVGSASSLEHL